MTDSFMYYNKQYVYLHLFLIKTEFASDFLLVSLLQLHREFEIRVPDRISIPKISELNLTNIVKGVQKIVFCIVHIVFIIILVIFYES